MRNPSNRIRQTLPIVGVAILLVASLGLGCSTGHDHHAAALQDGSTMWVGGLRPSWDVVEMVGQSDAIVVGIVSETLGGKREAGGREDPPRFYYEYIDFALAVEEVLHPANGQLPARIAVLTEAGISPGRGDIAVMEQNDIPDFQTGERVLLFLDSLEDSVYAEGVGRPVPEGFRESSYFQVVIGGNFAKLTAQDGKWEDGRSRATFTPGQLNTAIADHGGRAQ